MYKNDLKDLINIVRKKRLINFITIIHRKVYIVLLNHGKDIFNIFKAILLFSRIQH